MSEQAPERSGSSGGSTFTRKLGPLPLWAWLGIFTAIVFAYSMYKKKGSTTTGAGTSSGATSVNSPGGVDSSLVPQFVNQVYDSDTPPPAPNVTINNTVPPPPTVTPPPVHTHPNEPATVSGAPGSYTTGLGTGFNEWTSTGKYSINTVAKSHGMTAQQLIAASEAQTNNPALKAYVKKGNLNAPVPSGVALFIPTANWKLSLAPNSWALSTLAWN